MMQLQILPQTDGRTLFSFIALISADRTGEEEERVDKRE